MRRILFICYFTCFCLVLIPFVVLGIPLYWLGMPKNFNYFWYNLDRACASGTWGVVQETISSMVGRIAIGAGKPDGWTPRWKFEQIWTKAVARWLNTNPQWWGVDHTKNAILHADALVHADDGREQ